jgi:hypothetical protein
MKATVFLALSFWSIPATALKVQALDRFPPKSQSPEKKGLLLFNSPSLHRFFGNELALCQSAFPWLNRGGFLHDDLEGIGMG